MRRPWICRSMHKLVKEDVLSFKLTVWLIALVHVVFFSEQLTIMGADFNGRENTQSQAGALQGQIRRTHSHASDTQDSHLLSLSNKVFSSLDGGKVEDAIKTQHQVISLLKSSPARTKWRLKSEEALLAEMIQVSKLSADGQGNYLKARQCLAEGLNEINLRDYNRAMSLLEQALATFVALVGDQSISAAGTLEYLGITSLYIQKPQQAKDYLSRAMSARKLIVGQDHPDYSNVLSLFASACLDNKEFTLAEETLRDALSRDRKMFGTVSARYADGLEKLSRLMLAKGNLVEAESLCLQSQSIAERVYGNECFVVARCSQTLADINITFGEYEIAESNLKKSVRIYERLFPSNKIGATEALNRLIWLLKKLNRAEESETLESKLREMQAR